MGWRIRKRIKICKGLYFNLSNKGISTSAKIGNVTLNSRGRMSASIPGTGISYSTSVRPSRTVRTNRANIHNKPGWFSICFWMIIFFPIGIYKLIKKLA